MPNTKKVRRWRFMEPGMIVNVADKVKVWYNHAWHWHYAQYYVGTRVTKGFTHLYKRLA